MARALTIQRTIIPPGARKTYLARAKARHDHYARAKCNFWLFEESEITGAFIEFTEAPSAQALKAAHASAPSQPLDPARVYEEVQL